MNTKHVCTCGGGMGSAAYLKAHIAKPGFWGIYGINSVLKIDGSELPQKHHAPLATADDYSKTELSEKKFKEQVASWKAAIAKAAPAKKNASSSKPQCSAAKADGAQCGAKAKQGAERCNKHPKNRFKNYSASGAAPEVSPVQDERLEKVENTLEALMQTMNSFIAASGAGQSNE